MRSTDYTIAALWMEGALSYLEQLCLKSFVDAGHRNVVLYHYGPLQNVPDGIQLADANDILPQTNFLTHERTGSPALHSDLFRYKMLKKMRNTIWADTDAYCVRKFDTPNGHFHGWESDKHVNGGVLGLPHDCATLAGLLEFTSDEFAIPPYYGPEYVAELEAARAAGTPVHASEQPWGVWGPHAVTHFLKETGEVRHSLPQEALYPFTFKNRRDMLKRNFDTAGIVTENTYSIHLYGRRMRARLVEREGGAPHPKSLLGKLLIKHGIVPAAAPIKRRVMPQDTTPPRPSGPAPGREALTTALAPADRRGRGQVNLTDLADRFGTDKGSGRHRYTEFYQMVFAPLRTRAIHLLELGLQDGGPEHGAAPERATTDLPSVRMWLEYFPKGRISGLDVSDFTWFQDPRFRFLQCDLERRADLAAVTDGIAPFDIVIDDASHASHHQQSAFLELFGRVKPGGFYMIEGLRWQPDALEQPKITKTAELFRGYIEGGVFSHDDPAVAADFNAFRADISGCILLPVHYKRQKRDQLLVVQKR
jgi:hypothetical protein|tara:strand:+ start:43570 stop:45174 length:1605 start_codon:yes stop_codon:yes gene_type:complete